jgi:DNA-binding IclR family transcriptional regulator
MAAETARKPRKAVIRQVPAVTRAVAILRFLARSHAPVGVVQLANALDMFPSTCLHILRVLSNEGLVSFEALTKKYQLGAGVLVLANDFVSKNSLVQVVRPYLEEISRRHRCTAVAVEPSGPDHYIVIATTNETQGMSVRVATGTRMPTMVSATGRCLAAYGTWTQAELRRKFARLRWDNPPSFETWYSEVQEVRRRGFALDIGNYILGITIVAAPILTEEDTLIGALVSVAVSDQMKGAALEALSRELVGATERVRQQLGYAPKATATAAAAVRKRRAG